MTKYKYLDSDKAFNNLIEEIRTPLNFHFLDIEKERFMNSVQQAMQLDVCFINSLDEKLEEIRQQNTLDDEETLNKLEIILLVSDRILMIDNLLVKLSK